MRGANPRHSHKTNMTIQEAIEIASENGWRNLSLAWNVSKGGMYTVENGSDKFITYEQILLDPLFWQSLGKGLGWGVKIYAVAYFSRNPMQYISPNLSEMEE
jgi:hypothetical protein